MKIYLYNFIIALSTIKFISFLLLLMYSFNYSLNHTKDINEYRNIIEKRAKSL